MLRKLAYFARGSLWTLALRLRGAKIGRRLRVEAGFQIRQLGVLSIGDDVVIGPGCIFDAPGRLTIGNRATLTAWNFISALTDVRIGQDCQFGERVSIRDANHGMEDSGIPMSKQPMAGKPIYIGDDVWLGCGVAVLSGVAVGDGAVVGSNSVVTRAVEPRAVMAGAPARRIGSRNHRSSAAVVMHL